MTGHGDPSYYNEKYLDRLEEIKKYYKIYKPEKYLLLVDGLTNRKIK